MPTNSKEKKMKDQTSLKLYKDLKKSKYSGQIDAILNENNCDIDPSFLAFCDVYRGLSLSIDREYEIYDFGCAYNFQNYYFRNHKKYHAINPNDHGHMVFENTVYVEKTGQEFLQKMFEVPEKCFAICSAVPDSVLPILIKHKFNNCFIWYP